MLNYSDIFLPIILGSDENAYGTVRLFREAYGIKPLLVCTRRLTPTMDSVLFDIEKVECFDRDEVFKPALLSILKKYTKKGRKLIVIACSDYYSEMMSKYYDSFEGLIANRFISPELLSRLDTKDRFYNLCDECGLDYPKTVIVTKENRMSALDSFPPFPVVVKPENSNAYEYLHCSFKGKEKVFYFSTRDEYIEVIKSMNESDYSGKLIVQEFIPGGDDAMRVINCYSDSDRNVRMMCLGQPILEEYTPKMRGNYAAIISRNDEALYDKIKGFLQKIGYIGFSNIDMKFDSRKNKYMMLEINPRLGRSSYFVRAAGLNMMCALVDDVVLGQRKPLATGNPGTLWTAVPKVIIRKYVTNPEMRAEALKLFKKGSVTRTLFCPEDRKLKRRFHITRYYLSHIKTYKQYYFDKTKTRGV